MIKYVLPILVFLSLTWLFIKGLQKDPSLVPSPLIGKPVPTFVLPQLVDSTQTLTNKDLKGGVVLLNVWGSYCIPCREEQPLLMELHRNKVVDIYGLSYADDRANAIKYLQTYGNPFKKVAFDKDSRVAIDFGVYGVPETYIIDQKGIIRYKKVGAISRKLLDSTILPMINKLKKDG